MLNILKQIFIHHIKKFSFAWLALVTLSIIFINMQQPYYEAKATYIVNEKFKNPQSLIGGGASALLGISANSENNFLSLELMKSRDVFMSLYKDMVYIKNVYAAHFYDGKNISYDPTKLDKNGNLNKKDIPTFEEAYEDFHDGIFTFSVSEKTGFIKASVRHISPIYAKELLEETFNLINLSHQRNELKSSFESQDNIKKIIEKSSYSTTEVKNFLNKLFATESQDQIILLKDSKLLLKSIDGPILPTEIAGPSLIISLILISIYSFVLFLIFCFSLAIYKESINQRQNNI